LILGILDLQDEEDVLLKLLKILIIFWILIIITGCSEIKNIGQDKTNNIPETSGSDTVSFAEDKSNVDLNFITIQKDIVKELAK
jgi:hypothetical protein